MPISPFTSYKNAVLRFQVASGDLVADRNGNLRPGTAVVEVEALLQQKRDPNKEVRPGVDTSAIWVEGYLVKVIGAAEGNELKLPSVVTPDSLCAATWQGRQGQFFMEFTALNPYLSALNIDLVNCIRGYFQFGSFVVSGEPWQPSPSPETGSAIQIPFAFGDASPKLIYTALAGQTVFTAQVVIQTAFDGDGAALTLGDAGTAGQLMSASQVAPTFPAEYETNPAYTYTSDTDIRLSITPGEGCTQGSGYVLLEIA